jgi:hypothetical protein
MHHKSFITIPKAFLAGYCFLANLTFGYYFHIKIVIKTQNGSANRTYIKMTSLTHSQYNRTGQQPYNSVPKGSIFQGSPLLRWTGSG